MERPENRSPGRAPSRAVLICVAVVASVLTGLSTPSIEPRPPARPAANLTTPKLTMPTSPRSDVRRPSFSRSGSITNPLLPVSQLAQVIQLGSEGGERVRVEVTLLPGTRTVTLDGRQVDAVATQVVAYADGRVAEVAVDLYAQSDDGAVWHLGEEAANYDEGVLVDREGSWLAGRDGRPAMVMPAQPQVGDVFRSDSSPQKGAQQITVRSVGQTVAGPRGQVGGALRTEEDLVDGTLEDKTFAPGYGELRAQARAQDEVSTVALALPIDAVAGAAPAPLGALSAQADALLASRRPDWPGTGAAVDAMAAQWSALAATLPAGMLVAQMGDRITDLVAAAGSMRPEDLRQAAVGVLQAALDLQLPHRPPADVDRDRLRVWARQLQADAADDDLGSIRGDIVAMEALGSRVGAPSDPARGPFDAALAELRAAAAAGQVERSATLAASLPLP